MFAAWRPTDRRTTIHLAGYAALLTFLLGACGDDDGRPMGVASAALSAGSLITLPDPGTTAEPSTSSTTATGTTGGSDVPTTGALTSSGSGGDDPGTTGAATSGPAPKFDLGDEPAPDDTGGPTAEHPCVKIDLLFVVDNSSSMKQEQVNLIASVPKFVKEIQQELADAESVHIGVVSTDAYEFNEAPCNDKLGALVTETGGTNSSAAKCGPYASGLRFMTEQDNLAKAFVCAAQVGTDGDGDEKPIDAALQALGPAHAAPGACNNGFTRDDALLVLVLITDEEEDGSLGDPPQWFNDLVALKGGIETNIVVLSLIGPDDPPCADANEIGHRLIEFTNMFTYGSIGQICAPNYQPFFHDAIAGIAEACGGFTPPG